MKIVHLCLGCFFPDGYSYQENMLPKFHKAAGYEVEVIASLETFDRNGKPSYLLSGSVYQNEHDIKVTRLEYRKPVKCFKKLKAYLGIKQAIEAAAPDILFIHGCQFCDVLCVVRYLKEHPTVKVFVDNHADFSNSATNFISKNMLHKILWRYMAHCLEPYTTKFYGVLPARVDFLQDVYKLPAHKCELLVMGADDEIVEEARRLKVEKNIRSRYHIAQDDFLVMTGGKMDAFKTQTLLLMQAVQNIKHPKLKLIVFGSVTPELKEQVQALADGEKVQYIGWVQSQDSYHYFATSDLVVFPGRHSVFWEQAVAQGIPMLCKYWAGTTHVDVGGNVQFLKNDSVDEMQDCIESCLFQSDFYKQMKKAAISKKQKEFLYSSIAQKALEMECK